MLSLFDLADLLLSLLPGSKGGRPVTVAIGVGVLCLAILVALFLLFLEWAS